MASKILNDKDHCNIFFRNCASQPGFCFDNETNPNDSNNINFKVHFMVQSKKQTLEIPSEPFTDAITMP